MATATKLSPWGKIQTSRTIADGIEMVSTASHGGFKLDRKNNAKMPKALRLPNGWYEEDVEYNRVVIIFPQFFDQETVKNAHRTIKDYHPQVYQNWSGQEVKLEESFVLRRQKFEKENADNYVGMSAFGDWKEGVPKGFVGVFAGKGGRKKNGEYPEDTKWFLVPSEEYEKRNMFFVIDPARHEEIKALN